MLFSREEILANFNTFRKETHYGFPSENDPNLLLITDYLTEQVSSLTPLQKGYSNQFYRLLLPLLETDLNSPRSQRGLQGLFHPDILDFVKKSVISHFVGCIVTLNSDTYLKDALAISKQNRINLLTLFDQLQYPLAA